MLIAAQSQPRFAGLDLRNFEEKRDREFSLDRLGRSSVDNAVVGYLLPRSNAAGEAFRPAKAFNGWAVLRARQLENPPVGSDRYGRMPVIPSPQTGEGLSENLYHAHVVTPQVDYYSLALHLRQLFARYGTVRQVRNETPSELRQNLASRIADSLRKVFRLGWLDRRRR